MIVTDLDYDVAVYGAPVPSFVAPADPYGLPPSAPLVLRDLASPVGRVRSGGSVVALSLLTCGLYWLAWVFATHRDIARHTRGGVDGPVGLMAALPLGLGTAFLLPGEIARLYARRGAASPVASATGVWFLVPFVGFLIWQTKVSGALNAHWQGVSAADRPRGPRVEAR